MAAHQAGEEAPGNPRLERESVGELGGEGVDADAGFWVGVVEEDVLTKEVMTSGLAVEAAAGLVSAVAVSAVAAAVVVPEEEEEGKGEEEGEDEETPTAEPYLISPAKYFFTLSSSSESSWRLLMDDATRYAPGCRVGVLCNGCGDGWGRWHIVSVHVCVCCVFFGQVDW